MNDKGQCRSTDVDMAGILELSDEDRSLREGVGFLEKEKKKCSYRIRRRLEPFNFKNKGLA